MVAAMYMVPVLRDDCDSIVLVQAMLPSAERKLQAGEAPLDMEFPSLPDLRNLRNILFR